MDKFARFRFQPCIPLGEDGRCVTASAKHIKLSREAASEGMVLLKNENNALPLKKGTRVALFGKATIEYIKGGGGSGDVYTPYIRNIFDGFKEKENEGKVSVYMPLVDFYREYVEAESVNIPTQAQINATWDIVNAMEFCKKRDDMTYDTFASMHVKEPEVPDSIIKSAADRADTAVITVSRFSAEGVDRRPIDGDYYLSDIEKNLIDKAGKLFKKVIVVINSGAVIDCEYFAEKKEVAAVLFGWQGGLEGLRLNVGAQRGYEPLNRVLGARRLAQHGAILTPEGNKRLAPLPLSTSEIVASMARSAVCMASTASANTLCSYGLVSTRVLSIADFAMIEVG